MIERLDMNDNYSENEVAIHLNRYFISKTYCSGKKVLDIACGEGYGSYLISTWGAKEVIGIDISKEAIKNANNNFNNSNLKFLEQDATNLEALEDNYFDLVVSFETFEHVPNVEKYLKEIKRVAKEEAIIIISCPNDYYYYPNDEQKNPYHMAKYTFEDFKKITEKYFGKNVQYMVGKELMGFANVLLDEKPVQLKNGNMIDVFNNIECKKIKTEKPVTALDCNYYVGLWNIDELNENCCMYPHMYTDWKASRDTLISDNDVLKKYNGELELSLEKLKNDLKDSKNVNRELENNIKKVNRELEKESLLNRILISQKEEVNLYAAYLNEQLNEERTKNNQLNKDYESAKKYVGELERERERLAKENLDYYDKNETLKMQLDQIKNSKSYKITRKIVKMVKRK